MMGFSLMSTQCSKDDAELSQSIVMKDLELTARSDNWSVSYFLDSGTDKTESVNNLIFSFNPDGRLEVFHEQQSKYAGAWAIDGSLQETAEGRFSNIDFKVYFATPRPLRVFNKNWRISSYNSNAIELVANQTDGQMSYLKLERSDFID